jgi:hypothetical protein
LLAILSSGIDDAKNIARIAQRMLRDGFQFELTWGAKVAKAASARRRLPAAPRGRRSQSQTPSSSPDLGAGAAASTGGGDTARRLVVTSALCLMPPQDSQAWTKIQAFRARHDRQINRWPPHINVRP